jgi:Pyruvate/2-oxoacid:ferredoxin oxidoreductase delta subunit
MGIRKIIKIDEDKCTGCGLCIPGCAEGALQIVDGKARLVKDVYCDGLGACLGECPEGALSIIEREADEFDEKATQEYLKKTGRGHEEKKEKPVFKCPSSQEATFAKKEAPGELKDVPSALTHWPVKIELAAAKAKFFENADLLIAADCAPFAYGSFHNYLIRGRAVIIGCPKLNDNDAYLNKIAAILKENDIKSVTVAHMEVPCCFGLDYIVEKAIKLSEKDVKKKKIILGIKGNIVEED